MFLDIQWSSCWGRLEFQLTWTVENHFVCKESRVCSQGIPAIFHVVVCILAPDYTGVYTAIYDI